RTCEASSGVPTLVVNTRPVSCHSGPAARRDDACHLRCSRSAATALCGNASVRRDFSVLVSPCNRTDRHTAMLGGTGVRVAVQVDVIPPQRPGFLGPDTGGQGEDHVGAETRVILGRY